MSAEETWYIDSSAIVKLIVREPESAALRRFLKRRQTLVASALTQTEVSRAVLPLGEPFLRRASDVLDRIELVRVNRQVLRDAAVLEPVTLSSLDAIHLATAALFADTLGGLITYDGRMMEAAGSYGWSVKAPS
ncbi:MAG: type II toxin-antitoxin system VapC family toxin [Actinobacteria bacterium]|nr:type II toxin-antitoxin system VapC family toxin [Actinomycetota bacterium]